MEGWRDGGREEGMPKFIDFLPLFLSSIILPSFSSSSEKMSFEVFRSSSPPPETGGGAREQENRKWESGWPRSMTRRAPGLPAPGPGGEELNAAKPV
ncbi:hypothetical protein EYF80_065296 [Liparis tanakae]|uniref:Uncharacterized protein n=1 Tax=Liparis tanakae TaxID=230148 RepID=A0A4Z2E6Z3_9TELE|nr:hypothetical protein EYF80_065296 [Liparis tanakae]